ncbi:hypothetical protein D3C84_876670 [compost metagenome]
MDNRLVVNHAAAVFISSAVRKPRKYGLVITQYQVMARLTVLEVIMQAFFVTQALDEVQVGFVILHAVVTRRITCT